MKLLKTKGEVQLFRASVRESGNSLGLVPTMGALHQGHLHLVKTALSENDEVLVSIFVNPTQFNNSKDLEKYPKTLEEDLNKLQSLEGSIHVFAPEVSEMYGDEVRSRNYDFDGLDKFMEGAFRKGHFKGVGTIVENLLRLILPDRAYFGEKDYQQLQIIRKLVSEYEIPVEIIPCPIVREADGLAMSSRNRQLTKRLRKKAAFIYKSLKKAQLEFGTKSAVDLKEEISRAYAEDPDFELEYFEISHAESLKPVKRPRKNEKYRAFVAAYLGEVRLIDNIALN
ncbi:pantoate--beta-alanine ligase [Robiginitalea sp. IMCC43444]|uniref:pantoate--beta-alanine ligase n=1 Tax=Robiginitalea sp. IMCC43444 TaxID=3459121 RepID=UPI0040416215